MAGLKFYRLWVGKTEKRSFTIVPSILNFKLLKNGSTFTNVAFIILNCLDNNLIDLFKKILVAIDGSDPSNRALDYAIDISAKWGAKLVILVVVPKTTVPIFPDQGIGSASILVYGELERYEERMKEIYRNVLNDALEKVKRQNKELEVEGILKEGRPSSTIVDMAERDGVDLIVIGSRGVGGITGWILGSTSRKVVDSCTKPILVIK